MGGAGRPVVLQALALSSEVAHSNKDTAQIRVKMHSKPLRTRIPQNTTTVGQPVRSQGLGRRIRIRGLAVMVRVARNVPGIRVPERILEERANAWLQGLGCVTASDLLR